MTRLKERFFSIPTSFILAASIIVSWGNHVIAHETNNAKAPTNDATNIETELHHDRFESNGGLSMASSRSLASVSCPSVGGPPLSLTAGSTTLYNSEVLCTLTKITTTSSGTPLTVPIALSYDSNPWEVGAGEFATSLFGTEGISCHSPTSTCQIELPVLKEGDSYALTSFDYTLSDTDEFARFLETATYGITEEELNKFNESPDNVKDYIASWISDQMNADTTPITSHREYWRSRIEGRLPFPQPATVGDHPCQLYSRWRTFSFHRFDKYSTIQILGDGPYELVVNGVLRTVIDSFDTSQSFDPTYVYPVCRGIGGLWIRVGGKGCTKVLNRNPDINLDGFESKAKYIVDLSDDDLERTNQWLDEDVYKLNTSLFDDPTYSQLCAEIPAVPKEGSEHVFGRRSDGTWMVFDPILVLQENTLTEPVEDGGKKASEDSDGITQCSNVPRSFLNENDCQLSAEACSAASGGSEIDIVLDDPTIAALNHLTGRYLYAIEGLLVNHADKPLDHPCTPGLRSRWELKDVTDCYPTELHNITRDVLSDLLSGSGDTNPFLRDIYFPEEATFCDGGDTDPEIEIEVDDECWTRVHPEHRSVYDMTYWVDYHPGGKKAIQKWSENNGTTLVYPSLMPGNEHGMIRWNTNAHYFTSVGRFGDHLSLGDLPAGMNGVAVSDYFSAQLQDASTTNVVVCGSPGEVANDRSNEFVFDLDTKYHTGYNMAQIGQNRKYVWTAIALSSIDQLRQRVSWAMAQILVIVSPGIGFRKEDTEIFVTYYDIFVRHAFGNFRDVLRETSYNALMAEHLSFLKSKSHAYVLQKTGVKTSADENFAREIMQLFSMGLVQLNMDGSPKLDSDGNQILTYTNEDIESLSRLWTGFDRQPQRGNIESWDIRNGNRVDPMRIIPDWRDKFPKTDTTGGYIGDNYPLCNDFPSKPFLKKGAKYRLLGGRSLPELMKDPYEFSTEEETVRVVLDETSALRSLLCNEDQDGNCNFKNIVTLEANEECSGIECEVDTLRVVEVEPNLFYEFVHPPCVTLAFYNDPLTISTKNSAGPTMCADPTLPVAAEACCTQVGDIGTRNSKYTGERVTFATASSRCADISRINCNSISDIPGPFFLSKSVYYWTDDSCLLQVKINRGGKLTTVHKPNKFVQRVGYLSTTNENFFKVYWEGGDYPSIDNDCDGVCTAVPTEGACLCDTEVVEDVGFDSMPSSKDEIIDKLKVGAPDPSTFEDGEYTSTAGSDFTVHLKDNQYSSETIFEYGDDKGRTFFVKNIITSVHLTDTAGNSTGYSFRNTPQFMSFIPSETNLRDAQYETEAALDHYFYHDATPPFLAVRLIQRLVTSNPEPRYVQAVSEAFKTGSYTYGGFSFGSGKYGDLAAFFAAIYLDRAARSVLLDKDITNGMIREPILKVMSVMRSMEYESHIPAIVTEDIIGQIGQMSHEFDTVFSFFLPEFKPFGPIGNAMLVSPEATLLDMPKSLGFLNSMNSLIEYGLTSYGGGLGETRKKVYGKRKYAQSESDGVLSFHRMAEADFSFETFEGPSLKGGLDNKWVGWFYESHNGKVTTDPMDSSNNVVHFPTTSSKSHFYSQPITNGESLVVKFRYFSSLKVGGGCIGLSGIKPTGAKWFYCDTAASMQSNGEWKSCQFPVPKSKVYSRFRIILTDREAPGGDAYFDDIQIGTGTGKTCTGVDVPSLTPPGEEGYSSDMVDKLSTLLTAGRLGSKTKSIIVDAFDSAGSADDGLATAQKLIISTPEFHTTNLVESTDELREPPTYPQSSGKPYRAVVNLFLAGGLDSFNMLVPHTCENGLFEQYTDVRQQVALMKGSLLPVSASNQVCSKFGLHPKLTALQSLYNDGDLLFFANTGVMSQPVGKDNYMELTKTQLFAHNFMQWETKRIDPYEESSSTGILGRMADVLMEDGVNSGSFSVGKFSVAVAGLPELSSNPVILSTTGVPEFYPKEEIVHEVLTKLNNKTESNTGIFASTFSDSLVNSIYDHGFLSEEFGKVETATKFPNTDLAKSMETITKVIATRDVRGAEVDTFYVELGGFDTHSNVEYHIDSLLNDVNNALEAFASEIKSMNLWNNVTLLQTSDFARTLAPNGGDGTDHAWGGNYVMMGGGVKGKQILGTYPDDFSKEHPTYLDRGRLIPTTPWEAVFRGIASWLGIDEDGIKEVCPNIHRFDSSFLIDKEDMFLD